MSKPLSLSGPQITATAFQRGEGGHRGLRGPEASSRTERSEQTVPLRHLDTDTATRTRAADRCEAREGLTSPTGRGRLAARARDT